MRQKIVSAVVAALVRIAHVYRVCVAGHQERRWRNDLYRLTACGLLVVTGCTYQVPEPVVNNTDTPRVVPVLSEQGQTLVDQSSVALVRVTLIGDIYLNGEPVSLEELKEGLVEYKERDGVVWYYRDDPELSPPRAAMEVMPILVDAGMPIKLSYAEDFSDAKSRGELNLPVDEPTADGEATTEAAPAADTEVATDENQETADQQNTLDADAPGSGETTEEGQGAGQDQIPDEDQSTSEDQTLSGDPPMEEGQGGDGAEPTPDERQVPQQQQAPEAEQ